MISTKIILFVVILLISIIIFMCFYKREDFIEKYVNISTSENFEKYLNVAMSGYFYLSEYDFDNNIFKKDSSGNYIDKKGDNVIISDVENAISNKDTSNYFYQVTKKLSDLYNLSDFQLLYGNQQNLSIKTGIFGYIAKTKDNNAIICLRGTSNFRDWLTDFNVGSRKITDIPEFTNKGISDSYKVYKGFALLYGIERGNGICISKQIYDWVNKNSDIANYKICGHSLGASLACIASYQLLKVHNKNIETFLYACPRTFSREIVSDLENNYLNLSNNNIYNFYNSQDLIHAAMLSVIDLDSSILGFNIPYSGNSGCFQHIGNLLSIDYVDPSWPKNEQFIYRAHTIEYGYKGIIDIWKNRIFNNRVFYYNKTGGIYDKLNSYVSSKPNIDKFKEYSNILNYIYNNTTLFKKSFYQLLGVPSSFNTDLQNISSKFNITSANILYISKINSLTPNISYPVGIIGIYKGNGIIILGMDYDNFPEKLSYNDALPSFLNAVPFTEIKDSKNNNILGDCKIVEIYRKLYFYNCARSYCLSNNILSWLNNNNTIKNFTIIGQNAGSCFALLSALDIYSKGKIINDIYLYGSPKIGDNDFVNSYNNLLGDKTYLFLNNQDPFVNLLPYLSNIYGRIISSNTLNIFGQVGQIYNSDGVPTNNSKCEFQYFDFIRNPRAYVDVKDWDKILS